MATPCSVWNTRAVCPVRCLTVSRQQVNADRRNFRIRVAAEHLRRGVQANFLSHTREHVHFHNVLV